MKKQENLTVFEKSVSENDEIIDIMADRWLIARLEFCDKLFAG